MEASGKGLLKVTGILMIIFGGLSVIFSIISMISSIAFLPILGAIILISSIISLIGALLELATGIVGVKNCNDPSKAKPCIILCGIIILLSIISFIITICIGSFSILGLISFLIGLVLPGLYMWGAIRNQREADLM